MNKLISSFSKFQRLKPSEINSNFSFSMNYFSGLSSINSFFNIRRTYFCSISNTNKVHNSVQVNKSLTNLNKTKTPEMIHLQINPFQPRVEGESYEWSHNFFDKNEKISLPVLDIETSKIIKDNRIEIPHNIFNCPIRKDLIHRVYLFNKAYHQKTTKYTKSKSLVAGSGKKPFKQKGGGRARQGNARAPNLRKGGHAFALYPRKLRISLNKKIRLQGLKSMLSNKFLNNQIIVFNKIESEGKIQYEKILSYLNRNKALVYTPKEAQEKDFTKEKFKIKTIRIKPIGERTINVMELLHHKFLIFSPESLKNFITMINDRENNYYRITRKFKNQDGLKYNLFDKYKFNFDPKSELEIHTPALKGSLNRIYYYELNPDKLEEEINRRYNERRASKGLHTEYLIEEMKKRSEAKIDKAFKRKNKAPVVKKAKAIPKKGSKGSKGSKTALINKLKARL